MKGDNDNDPKIETIETYCCDKRVMVRLDLEIKGQDKKDRWIGGVPIGCDSVKDCKKGPLCMLKAEEITVQRSR